MMSGDSGGEQGGGGGRRRRRRGRRGGQRPAPAPPAAAPPETHEHPRTPETAPQFAGGQDGARRRRRRGGRGRGGAPVAAPPPIKPEYPPERFQAPLTPTIPEIAPELPAASAPARVHAEPAPAKRKPRGVLVLAIGLPGSGKSSWFKRRGVTPLSSDLLRTLLFDNIGEQRYQDLVFSTLRSVLRARLIAGMPWNYVDATNLSPHERHGWIKMARDFSYEAHAVFFDVPLEVCMERNHRRARVVPEEVMRRMAQKLRPPTFEEGFAKIIVVRVKKKEGDTEPESDDIGC